MQPVVEYMKGTRLRGGAVYAAKAGCIPGDRPYAAEGFTAKKRAAGPNSAGEAGSF